MIIKGIEKPRKPYVRPTALVLACLFAFLECLKGQYGYAAFMVVVVLACFFDKEHIISEDGVDIQYSLFGAKSHNYWSWDEVTTIHADRKTAAPNVMLHISKDVVTRPFVVKPSQVDDVLRLAGEKNPKIYMENKKEEELREEREKAARMREAREAQKKAIRNNRKKKK